MIADSKSKLTQDLVIDTAFELGFGDSIFIEDSRLKLVNLTPLQMVALAAGLAAVAESGGQQIWYDEHEHRGEIHNARDSVRNKWIESWIQEYQSVADYKAQQPTLDLVLD